MNPILLFTIATIINVVVSTIRSLCTIKGGKWLSAITNAVCYGFYPLIVMLTAKDTVDIVTNMIITAVVNFICVWIIKLVEQKARKDRLWKVEATVEKEQADLLHKTLKLFDIPHHYYENVGRYTVFNIFCATQKESAEVRDTLNNYGAKWFVSESKIL